jgi:hypothetical protein
MNRLYKLTGLVTKTKTVEDIYVIACSNDQAVAEAETFATEVVCVGSEKLGKGWN